MVDVLSFSLIFFSSSSVDFVFFKLFFVLGFVFLFFYFIMWYIYTMEYYSAIFCYLLISVFHIKEFSLSICSYLTVEQ